MTSLRPRLIIIIIMYSYHAFINALKAHKIQKLLVYLAITYKIIITYIYHALINALSAHVIHINLKYNILYTCRICIECKRHPSVCISLLVRRARVRRDKPYS